MLLRLAGYLSFLWVNAALGLIFLGESTDAGDSDGGGTGVGALRFFRAWWLVLLSVVTSLALVTLTTTDPGKVRKEEFFLTQQSEDSSGSGGGSNNGGSGTGGGGSGVAAEAVAGGGGGGEGQLCPASGPAGAAVEAGLAQQQQQYFTQVCTLCHSPKPARAHHCRICNRCVLKMDHHCHWVGRCVGAGNYKAYLLTLFYACVSSGTMLLILWRRRGSGLGQGWNDGASRRGSVVEWIEIVGVAVDGLVLMFVFCAVSYLLLWHAYLVAGNVTTIEYYKWKRSMRDPRHYGLSRRAPSRLSAYDAGLLSNVREALGSEAWLWLWPGLGDGCGANVCGSRRSGGGVSVRGMDGVSSSGGDSVGGWWQGAAEAKNFLLLATRRRRSRRGAGRGGGGDDDEDDDDGTGFECVVAAHEAVNLNPDGDDSGGGRSGGSSRERTDLRPMSVIGHGGRPEPA